VLTGSDDEIMARIGEYVAAGADQVNIALRAPFDLAALDRFSAALGSPERVSPPTMHVLHPAAST
jgi:hypothetical protein